MWRPHPVMVSLCLAGLAALPAQAKDYFNPAFLDDGSGQAVDLSAYEQAGTVPEGDYLVDVFMNQSMAFTRQVHFARTDKGDVLPVLTLGQLKSAGVAIDRVEALKGRAADTVIKDIRETIPGATVKFDMSRLRLDLTVPQTDMLVRADGTVDPSLWDEGVPGAMFSYMMSGSRSETDGYAGMSGSHSDSLFGSVNGGLNLGAWRLRSNFSYNQSNSNGQGYSSSTRNSQFSNTYVQRDVQALRGELYAGEKSTGGDIFDSISFRGVQLVSEDQMLPNSQRGFSPVVSGIAKSTAKVSVRQNGQLIYETTVPPGPFKLTDINGGGGGELEVTVTEADGSRHVSTQNYATLGTMKRSGGVDYEVSVGKYHGNNGQYEGSRDPLFALTTVRVGLPLYVTLYGGLLVSEKYQSSVIGAVASLGILGALSLDATLANAKVRATGRDGADDPGIPSSGDGARDQHERGVAWRMQFARNIDTTGTGLTVSGTRYSRDYMSFQDVATAGYGLTQDQAPWLRERRRSNWQVNLSQSLWRLGSIFLNASRNDYWGSDQVVKSVGGGFSSSLYGVGYSVNYNEDRTQSHAGSNAWPTNRQVSLNVNVPFSLFNPQWQAVRDMYATYSMTHDNKGRTSQQSGLSGSALDSKLSWNVSQNHDNQGGGSSGNAGLGWSGDRVSTSLNYGYGSHTRTLGGSASGGLVLHPHGVTLARSVGDSMALVEAPGAGGVSVGGTSTDSRGYAVVPYLQNYQRNDVTLNTATLPDGVDIQQSSAQVYPTKGAIVEAKFKTRVGRQAMLTLNYQGRPVPFGAIASLPDDDVQTSAIVGDDGMVYLTGAPQSGLLKVRWGTEAGQQCQVRYDLGALPKADPKDKDAPVVNIVQKTLTCVPVASASAVPAPTAPPVPEGMPVTPEGKRLAESLPLPQAAPASLSPSVVQPDVEKAKALSASAGRHQ
ncbi:fimbria/pilus outer membrane usher protein [Enterobacter asburiae]|uniref:fimbria/pilus outer membrane usher protein n=1 Tax=Enterobacter asburiae TaxID=61645 RepID=UPI003F554927